MGKPVGKNIKLRNVRLSFPVLDKPRAFREGQEESYNATFLLDPKRPEHKAALEELKAEAERLIKETWGQKPVNMKPIEFMGKGETKVSQQTGEVYDGYANMYFVAAKNKKRPALKNRDGEHLTPQEVAQVFYGGCRVNAIVSIWVQDNKWGKALRCNLSGIKFHMDDDAFGGGSLSDEEWSDFDDADSGDIEI